jgi:hypothetical protein
MTDDVAPDLTADTELADAEPVEDDEGDSPKNDPVPEEPA